MGESQRKVAKREEMLLSCAGVQTMAGRVQVRWASDSAATPMGQLAYFIEFLNLTGLWANWVESAPLSYASANAPSKADVLGTWMLSILAGHRRYAHVTAMRCDGVNPGLLGMDKVVSEDALRNALKRMPEAAGTAWLDGHLSDSVAPLLEAPWILAPTPPLSRCTATRKAPCWATTRESQGGPRMPITPTSWRGCAKCLGLKCAPVMSTAPNMPSQGC